MSCPAVYPQTRDGRDADPLWTSPWNEDTNNQIDDLATESRGTTTFLPPNTRPYPHQGLLEAYQSSMSQAVTFIHQ